MASRILMQLSNYHKGLSLFVVKKFKLPNCISIRGNFNSPEPPDLSKFNNEIANKMKKSLCDEILEKRVEKILNERKDLTEAATVNAVNAGTGGGGGADVGASAGAGAGAGAGASGGAGGGGCGNQNSTPNQSSGPCGDDRKQERLAREKAKAANACGSSIGFDKKVHYYESHGKRTSLFSADTLAMQQETNTKKKPINPDKLARPWLYADRQIEINFRKILKGTKKKKPKN